MVEIDHAFVQAFVDGFFELPIAYENEEYTPVAGTPYAELINLPNDVTAWSLADTDSTDGAFRIILRYPADTGAVDAKTKADEIMSVFSVGESICYSNVCATVTNAGRGPGVPEDGWYKVVITIGYVAYLTR